MRKFFAVSILFVLTIILAGCPTTDPDAPSAIYFAHVDNWGSGSVLAGGRITVLIPAPGGTSYFWAVLSPTINISNVLFTDIEHRTKVLTSQGLSAPGYYVFTFKALEAGTTTIQLGQFSLDANPETDTPEAIWSADVTVVGSMEETPVIGLSVADNNETRYLPVGAGMRIELLDTPLTDSVWTLTQDGAPVIAYNAGLSSVTASNSVDYGGLEFATFWFNATAAGTADIQLAYGVPDEEPIQTFDLSVVVIE